MNKKNYSLLFIFITIFIDIDYNDKLFGNNEEDNDIIFKSKRNVNANKKLYPHWDLVKSFNLINFEKGKPL